MAAWELLQRIHRNWLVCQEYTHGNIEQGCTSRGGLWVNIVLGIGFKREVLVFSAKMLSDSTIDSKFKRAVAGKNHFYPPPPIINGPPNHPLLIAVPCIGNLRPLPFSLRQYFSRVPKSEWNKPSGIAPLLQHIEQDYCLVWFAYFLEDIYSFPGNAALF